MMEFLKKNYQKIIEFVLLFVPLIILFDFLTGSLPESGTCLVWEPVLTSLARF